MVGAMYENEAAQRLYGLGVAVQLQGRILLVQTPERLRETFGSALDASELALRALDFGPGAARRGGQRISFSFPLALTTM